MRTAGVLLLIAACGTTKDPGVGPSPDASADAQTSCDLYGGFTPITVTGTSPLGPLDDFRFVRAGHADGGCADQYGIEFLTAVPDASCITGPSLMFGIFAPFDRTSIQTLATLSSTSYLTTNQVTFEVTQLDPPTDPMPRIVGHLVSHDPAWTFDIAIDLVSQSNVSCL